MSTEPNRATSSFLTALAMLSALGPVGLQDAAADSHTLEAVIRVYESGDYREAARLLRPYAERGDALSQLRLATLYRTGNGVEADEYEAAYWYRMAAQQGVPEAQFHLGLMYLRGDGVTESAHEALEWISRAARQGFGDAADLYHHILTSDAPMAC